MTREIPMKKVLSAFVALLVLAVGSVCFNAARAHGGTQPSTAG
jgi:hypothetical protein